MLHRPQTRSEVDFVAVAAAPAAHVVLAAALTPCWSSLICTWPASRCARWRRRLPCHSFRPARSDWSFAIGGGRRRLELETEAPYALAVRRRSRLARGGAASAVNTASPSARRDSA